MKLSDLEKGQVATITTMDSDQGVSQRLMALGLLPTCPVSLVQVAPLGDPITVECLGNQISLRKRDADLVEVSL